MCLCFFWGKRHRDLERERERERKTRKSRVDRKKRERGGGEGGLELKKGSKKLARLIDRLLSGFQFPSFFLSLPLPPLSLSLSSVSFLSTKSDPNLAGKWTDWLIDVGVVVKAYNFCNRRKANNVAVPRGPAEQVPP